MQKHWFVSIIIISLSSSGFAQKGSSQKSDPVILSSAGGEGKSSTMSLSWTLGEPVVATATSFEKMITQGFHQPVLLVKNQTPVIVKAEFKGLKINIAPNPVQSVLKIRIVSPNDSRVDMQLYTADGKKLFHKVSSGTDVTTDVNMTGYASGLYLLRLYNAFGLIKTFEIIKN